MHVNLCQFGKCLLPYRCVRMTATFAIVNVYEGALNVHEVHETAHQTKDQREYGMDWGKI